MTTIFDRVNAEHAKRIRADGVDITYVDGATQVELKALVGPARTEQFVQQGTVKLDGFEQDFLVVADDLVDDSGDRIEPRRGAHITRVISTRTYTYDIQPYRDERHWRWSGPGNGARRIHAKLITEAVT